MHSTLKTVFPVVKAYNQAVYSFLDEWGFNLAFTEEGAAPLSPEEVDRRIAERVTGEMKFLDGQSYQARDSAHSSSCLKRDPRHSLPF